jgi:hypothetical protein
MVARHLGRSLTETQRRRWVELLIVGYRRPRETKRNPATGILPTEQIPPPPPQQ